MHACRKIVSVRICTYALTERKFIHRYNCKEVLATAFLECIECGVSSMTINVNNSISMAASRKIKVEDIYGNVICYVYVCGKRKMERTLVEAALLNCLV